MRRDIFITTLIITLFVFGFGFWLGSYQDSFRVDYSSDSISSSELDTQSLVTERLFFERFGGKGCEQSKKRLESFNKQIYEVGKVLGKFDTKSISKQNQYNFLKRKYFLLELNTYLLTNQMKEECKDETKVLLFFYDIKDNEESLRQGLVLDTLVHQKSLVVFSFDREFTDEPLLNTIKEFYNVTKSPTLIINYKTKKEGLISAEELKKLL